MATRCCAARFLLLIRESTIELGDRNLFKYRNNYEISKIYRLPFANGQVMHKPDASQHIVPKCPSFSEISKLALVSSLVQ